MICPVSPRTSTRRDSWLLHHHSQPHHQSGHWVYDCQMSNSGYQSPTKRANNTHAVVEKWWTHADSMGWPAENQPTPTNTTNYAQLSSISSLQWPMRYLASSVSCAGPGTGKAGDHDHRRFGFLQRDHLLFRQLSVALPKGN